MPPLVAEAVGEELLAFLRGEDAPATWALAPLPESEAQAVAWLRPLLDRSEPALRRTGDAEFKRAWFAIAFLYAGLHPDGALDHGETIQRQTAAATPISRLEPRLLAPCYERSGWPVVLAPIAREAWRRYHAGYLPEFEFYCDGAQIAGMSARH